MDLFHRGAISNITIDIHRIVLKFPTGVLTSLGNLQS